jgi:hypothetical protein
MKYAVILAAALLTGCVTKPQIVERIVTVEVKVPVVTPIPEPKATVRPQLMIYHLGPGDENSPGKVLKYYKASVKQLQGYTLELEAIIEGYRQASKKQKENQE